MGVVKSRFRNLHFIDSPKNATIPSETPPPPPPKNKTNKAAFLSMLLAKCGGL